MLGTLDDVKAMVAAGDDVNQFIPESGEGPLMDEGPLMYAIRRAHMQKEPEILHYLLDLAPSVETVNRVASTLRETPLSVAIQMGSAEVVERLIALGARVSDPCDGFDSAHSYARALMAESQQIRESPQASEVVWRLGAGGRTAMTRGRGRSSRQIFRHGGKRSSSVRWRWRAVRSVGTRSRRR